jgi:hypothetical protein
MAAEECTIYLRKSEVESLKNKLANAEKTIEVQADTIRKLKGERNETV